MGADLALYTPPSTLHGIAGQVRPAAPGDGDALLAFLRREFPGRWRYEFEEFLADGGRLSDYMVLWTDRGIDGCCILTFDDSVQPIERFYPYRLPRPWGQLGSIGVSADCRGRGYGSALLDAGLRRLHNTGVNGCIIDWTTCWTSTASSASRPTAAICHVDQTALAVVCRPHNAPHHRPHCNPATLHDLLSALTRILS